MYMYTHTHVIFKCIWEIQVLVTPWQAGPPAQCFSGLRTLTSCTCSLSDVSALPPALPLAASREGMALLSFLPGMLAQPLLGASLSQQKAGQASGFPAEKQNVRRKHDSQV